MCSMKDGFLLVVRIILFRKKNEFSREYESGVLSHGGLKLEVRPRPAPKYPPKWPLHYRFPPQNEAKIVPKWASPILERVWLRFGVEIDGGRAILEGILEPAEAKNRA